MAPESTSKPIIKVNNLSVTYFMGKPNEVRALQKVSLEIFKGEFIIFFGPSGCGKSTLLYGISGLETHIQGDIHVYGKNIASMDKQSMAHFRQKEIGMIFQAFYLIPTLNVQQNVMLPQIAISVDKKKREEKSIGLLNHFGVETQKDKLPTELSGGQQQRVAICRSLVNDPDIILADEPTGNLDSKSAEDVMKLVKDLNEKQKKTVILVTHDPSHLHFAHRVFYMKDGKILETRVNREMQKETKKVEVEKVQPSITKELELLIRTYSTIKPGQLGTMLIPFKAKQIVSEVLTGMSSEELEAIEKQVEHMLISTLEKEEYMEEFLDKPKDEGGLELDKRTAKNLAAKIFDIVEEIRELQEEEKLDPEHAVDKEIMDLRHHIIREFNIHFTDPRAVTNLDSVLQKRIKNTIDKEGMETFFDLPPSQKGVGLDRRTARKIARHIELIMLGKFNI